MRNMRSLLIVSTIFVAACGIHLPPRPEPTPQPTPTPPSPVCAVGQTHSCWHCPPDTPGASTCTWLYACPIFNAEGQVIGVVNVAGSPAQCPKPPEPPPATCPESCPEGTHCEGTVCVPNQPPPPSSAVNCDGEPGAITGQTTHVYGDAVNQAIFEVTGCEIGSDCRLGNTTSQQFMRSVIDKLRSHGACAGQHEPGHTDEIAVSKDKASVREGYHIFAGDDSSGPAHDDSRRVVWSPFAARVSYYGTGEVPPPTTDDCPAEPCPWRVWTAETLPPGWGQEEIGRPALIMNVKEHTGGNGDSTVVTNRQLWFCEATGQSPYADGQPRASCPMRSEGGDQNERKAVEDWTLYGGYTRDGRNGQDCTPHGTDNPAAFLWGTGNCRMCDAKLLLCSEYH